MGSACWREKGSVRVTAEGVLADTGEARVTLEKNKESRGWRVCVGYCDVRFLLGPHFGGPFGALGSAGIEVIMEWQQAL